MPEHSATTALITGGTQGLGLAIAEQLLRDGCRHILLVGRDAAKGAATARRLSESGAPAFHADVAFHPADLAETAAAIAMINAAVNRFGRLTALVNAAAATDRGSILDTTPAAFDALMAVNARGPFFALQRFAQSAIALGHPAQAVNILSMVVHCGQSFLAPYSASKAALANITRNAAQALRAQHIRVNGINIGWMDTPGEDAVQRQYHGAQDGWLTAAEACQPFGMLIKPAHVAGLASFMLSPDSGVMTGSVVDFDQNVAGANPE